MIKNTDTIHQVDLVKVISQYVKLEKRGAQHIGCCPFHNEKTPSFHVSATKSLYKCFGCGEGGNSPVQFLMDHKGLSYPEALEEVARIGGITVEYERNRAEYSEQQKQIHDRKKQATELMQQVIRVYQPDELELYDTIDCFGKQYKPQTIAIWGIGYAPDGNIIKNLAKANDLDVQLLCDIGILKSSDRGGHYDFYRDRLLFPIHDHRGRVVAIGGRKSNLDTDPKNPKYINSPETLIYNKSETLYGLHINKRGIHKAQQAILVEGYTDVITMHEYGFDNAVASCGTALTTEQVKLLKRYTDQVLVLRDGDQAGHDAAVKDVETLILAGIHHVKVCLMKDKEDPDSFLRKHTARGLEVYIEDNAQDGLVWRVMLEFDEDDPYKVDKAINKAGELLAVIDSSTLRENYIRELTAKKNMGSRKQILKDAIAKYEKNNLTKSRGSDLTKDQENDIIEYGIYEWKNSYFVTSDPQSAGHQVSNFIIKPLMLVIGSKESQRIVEIANMHRSYVINMPSDKLVSITDLKKEVARYGNFRFFGKPEAYESMLAKVYQGCKDCFPITALGWNSKGFYAWGNGISVDGKFIPVDEYGIVEHDKVQYLLPAYSKVQDTFINEDSEENYAFEKAFSFHYNPGAIGFREWTQRMIDVHQDHGMIAVAYYIASLFRDIIFDKLSFFPHLNLFGKPQAGKGLLANSLMSMFGKDHSFFNLNMGTNVAFTRKLAQSSNAIVVFDEYDNDVDKRRIDQLKGAYDGIGREVGKADHSNQTRIIKVRSALIILGQQQPTQDTALFQRCITLNITDKDRTLEWEKHVGALKKIRDTGELTNITQYILSFREEFAKEFSDAHERISSAVKEELRKSDYIIPNHRIINNYAVIFTSYFLFAKKLPFAFSADNFKDHFVKTLVEQSNAMLSEDETAVFWRIVEYLLAIREISHFEDIFVEQRTKPETIMNELDRSERKDSIPVYFDEPTTLVYITFKRIHPMYQERHHRMKGKHGFEYETLKHYLKNSPAYVGQKRAKKFGPGGPSPTCFVFRLDELPVHFDLSIEATANTDTNDDFPS